MLALITGRPDVVCVVVASMALCVYERGWLRAMLWLTTGTAIGWAVEACSIRTGFPFGMYVYHPHALPDQIWIAGVPLFASLSLAGLAYFAYSAVRQLAKPLAKPLTGRSTIIVAAVSMTWMDTVIDPVTHLGKHWWLGDLYHYDPPGMHFGVPLSNYFGWLFTGLCIVSLNHLIDKSLAPRAMPERTRHLAIVCQLGTYLYMIGVTIYLLASGLEVVSMLLSGMAITAGYVAFVKLWPRYAPT